MANIRHSFGSFPTFDLVVTILLLDIVAWHCPELLYVTRMV